MNSHREINKLKVEIIWRLPPELADFINENIASPIKDYSGNEFAEILQSVDALITTPSTTMLEGMIKGIPVVLLDYTNSPHYVPAAWSITAPNHIEKVIRKRITSKGIELPSSGKVGLTNLILGSSNPNL